MLNSETLRTALKNIYGIDDRHLVPLDEGWYVPTFDRNEPIGAWIGYRILSKAPITRSQLYVDENGEEWYIRNCKVSFRLSFVGSQAEKLADETMMWEERADVQKEFEQSSTQINYTQRQQFSYPVKNGGFNDNLCWCVDFTAQTFMAVATNWKDWGLREVNLGGHINIKE